MSEFNTVFLRLAGPMQAWGTGSRLQLRRTDAIPSKSGILGLILCALGIRREDAVSKVGSLVNLSMGVRIDRCGETIWDYHTAGAWIGIRQAKGGVKFTASTKQPEAQLSRRQYLCDASFLVALQGDPQVIAQIAKALEDPVWPVFLGRKSCVPTSPVLAALGTFVDLAAALESQPWIGSEDTAGQSSVTLAAYREHVPDGPIPAEAVMVYDVPRTLQNPSHGARWIVPFQVNVPVQPGPSPIRPAGRPWVNYTSEQWRGIRTERLKSDHGLCVFCKCPAEDVHHVTYERVGQERIEDLRSLCKICHDACTQLEYGHDLRIHRVDPADPRMRDAILTQVQRLLTERRLSKRRSVRENVQSASIDFLAQAPVSGGEQV